MTDAEREHAIKALGVMLRFAMAHGYRRSAMALHAPWSALIRSRSDDQVRRMEREQGLRGV